MGSSQADASGCSYCKTSASTAPGRLDPINLRYFPGMKSFEELTSAGQVRRLRAAAEHVLTRYDIGSYSIRALVHIENTTFRVDSDAGTFALQIKRDTRTASETESEMLFLDAVRQNTSIVVPFPERTVNGELVSTFEREGIPGERAVVLYRWVDGRFMRKGIRPVHLRRLGRMAAELHDFAEGWVIPDGFDRPDLGWGSEGRPGRMRTEFQQAIGSSLIDEKTRRRLRRADDRLRRRSESIRRTSGSFGLIHADLHFANVLYKGESARAIDFDDCGYGYFMQDLGTTLWYLRRRPDYADLRSTLFDGYRERRTLTDADEATVEHFVVVRTLEMAQWFLNHTDNPWIRRRLPEVVVALAEELEEKLSV